MRILFFTDRYHPNLQGFVTGLLDVGHEVGMIAYTAWDDEHYDPRMHYEQLKPARLYADLFFKSGRPPCRYTVPNIVALNRSLNAFQPDVVVLKYISLPILFLNALCRIKRIRTVLYSPRSPHPTVKHRIRYRILSHMGLLPKNYFLVAIGGHTHQLLPNETCLPYAIQPDERAANRTYRDTRPLRILSVGKLVEQRKNNDMLIRTLAPDLKSGRARLTIIGRKGRENDVYHQLIQEISDHGVSDYVTLLANLPRDECLDAYLDHDLFVLPATGETAGMVILEAMAAGLPVICSDKAGLSICVEDGITGLTFQDNDATDLHRKIAYFLDRPAEARRMGQHAFARVHEYYTPAAFVARFENLLATWFGWQDSDAGRTDMECVGRVKGRD